MKHNKKGKGSAGTSFVQGNLWHCPSVSSQVRGTLGPAATGKERSTAWQSQAAFPHTRGANPPHDSSVQSAGSFADSCQHTFLFFTLLCHLPWSPQRPSCLSGEEPGLGLRDPGGRRQDLSLKITRLVRGQIPPLPCSNPPGAYFQALLCSQEEQKTYISTRSLYSSKFPGKKSPTKCINILNSSPSFFTVKEA